MDRVGSPGDAPPFGPTTSTVAGTSAGTSTPKLSTTGSMAGLRHRSPPRCPRDPRRTPPLAKGREQPVEVASQAEVTGAVLFEIEGTLVGAEASSEADDAEETGAEQTSTVFMGRGTPVAMKQFVRTVLEGALPK